MKNTDLHEPSVAANHAIAVILALTGAAGVLSSKFRGEAGGTRRTLSSRRSCVFTGCGEAGVGYVPSFQEER
jgi:hypothetical protein